MKKYVIFTDSCSDLHKDLRDKYDIRYVPMRFIYNDKDMEASLDWVDLSPKEFFDLMRDGTRIRTAAVNTQNYLDAFEPVLQEGYDILSISCTHALSTSVNSSYTARDELLAKYPDRKIVCVDSANSCGGEGMICIKAAMLRAEGKTIEETAAWLEENKLCFNQEAVVEKLTWLKQAGRVKATTAFFGNLLAIKPLLISDVHGNNVAIEKAKGRKHSLARCAERVAEEYVPNDMGIHIRHADCLEDALILKEEIQKRLGLPDEAFDINYLGPIIGASVGPGTLSAYFFGKKVTYDSLANK
ncbi:MAG: DegV family protein [Clostridia bacterium]|nr:DegV family protein [Clostridia bacterium]